jgi:hypothetical protein
MLIFYIQVFLSLVFFVSTYSKVISLNDFQKTLSSLGIIGIFNPISATFIIFSELLVSLLILFDSTRLIAEIVLIFLLGSFLVGATITIKTNKKIKCNCFGELSKEFLGKNTLVKIFFISILNVILLWSKHESGLLYFSTLEILFIILAGIGTLSIYFLINVLKEFKIIYPD